MKLKYGNTTIDFTLPAEISWQILHKDSGHESIVESDIIETAISDLTNQLKEIAIPAKCDILIIIPDHTRRCRLAKILPVLTSALENRFSANIQMLVANGSHVLQLDDAIRELVGNDIYDKYAIYQHDSQNEASLIYLGDSSRGTPIHLNRKVREADFIITVGGVLYHYFAGFGGGPKMLLPGVAGYETIRINHRRTIDEDSGQFHRECYEGNITTNPIFLDLKEVVKFVPNTISFQVVLNVHKSIVHAQAGPILTTHQNVCKKVQDIYSIPLKEQADVVVASAGGFPADVDLVQSHKSIHHAYQAVKEDGWVIILAACSEGIGSKTFMPYFDLDSAGKIANKLLRDYKLNGHTALALRTKTEKTHIVFVSTLKSEIVKKTGMIPAPNLAEAWTMVSRNLDPNATGYIMPMASVHVPIVTKD